MTIRHYLAAATTAIAFAAPAHADFIYIDLAATPASTFGTNTANFNIPNSSQKIVARAMPNGSSLVISSSKGLGVLSSGQSSTTEQQVDHFDHFSAVEEFLDFTFTAGVQSNFRLAAVEFTLAGINDQFVLIVDPSLFSATFDVTNLSLLNPYAHCSQLSSGSNSYDCFDVLLSGIPESALPSRLSFVGDIPAGQYGFAGQNADPMSGTEFLVGVPQGGWFLRSLVLQTVPEPTTLVLFGVGFVALGLRRRRQQPAAAL